MKIKPWIIAVIALFLVGLLINVIPMMSYYFSEEYQTSNYKGEFKEGAVFDYYFLVGAFKEKNEVFSLGMILHMYIINPNLYSVNVTTYKLMGTQVSFNIDLLPSLPFVAQIVKLINKNNVTIKYNESAMAELLFPASSKIHLINDTISSQSHHELPRRYLGYPRYYFSEKYSRFDYLKYEKRFVLYGFSAPFTFNSTKILLSLIYPQISEMAPSYNLVVINAVLGGGNDVPPQDWNGWLKYGIAVAFPVNIVLIISGVIVAIVYSRRGL